MERGGCYIYIYVYVYAYIIVAPTAPRLPALPKNTFMFYSMVEVNGDIPNGGSAGAAEGPGPSENTPRKETEGKRAVV